MRLWQKLVLLVLVPIIISVPVILYFLKVELDNKENLARRQFAGIEYIQPLRDYGDIIEDFRTVTIDVLENNRQLDDQTQAELDRLKKSMEDKIAQVDALNNKYGDIFGLTGVWGSLKTGCEQLIATALELSAEDSYLVQKEHETEISDFIIQIVNSSQLKNEIADVFLAELPNLATDIKDIERLSELAIRKSSDRNVYQEGVDGEIIVQLKQDGVSRDEISDQLLLVENNLEIIKRGSELYLATNIDLRSQLRPLILKLERDISVFVEDINNDIVRPATVTTTKQSINEKVETVSASIFAPYDSALQAIENLLSARIQQVGNQKIIILLVIGAAILLSLLIAVLVLRGVLGQIDFIRSAMGAYTEGDVSARSIMSSSDELGEMAGSVNQFMDENEALTNKVKEDAARVEDEYNRTQESIIKLLDEVSGIAEGDLTQEAEVTAEVTGAIADSFNNAIVELRRIITEVQSASTRVNEASSDIRLSMDRLSQGSEEQSGQIIDTTAAIDEMAISIRQVSENASMSATVAQQALSNAKQGAEVVENTITGMNNIRDQVQETSKRIKRLGESSQEIGEITQLIGEIADRTSILALNASIQAAMAGEAGRGFAVVAEEVERLADRATDSTKRIETLIKTIQAESNDAISAMEDMTNEVVAGSERAADAGKALGEIESVSVKLADLIQSISMAAQQQARGSETIANAMSDISMVTQQSTLSTREAFTTSAGLTELSEELGRTISAFKLPETNGASPEFTTSDVDIPSAESVTPAEGATQ
ncbi:MAG TPA: methyl-accepting chemotaxis protein [Thermodesulfobacteriota bacterium]|nr:methyl-accepting chemotaxis protein [Thermodesulfobacteriota bacterium]